jgi:hypothetical protein
MRETTPALPDPTLPAAALWLKGVDRQFLHQQGWTTANQRFHGLAMAARPFIAKHFPELSDQEAAFDGFALALMALAHFEDIERLSGLFAAAAHQPSPGSHHKPHKNR